MLSICYAIFSSKPFLMFFATKLVNFWHLPAFPNFCHKVFYLCKNSLFLQPGFSCLFLVLKLCEIFFFLHPTFSCLFLVLKSSKEFLFLHPTFSCLFLVFKLRENLYFFYPYLFLPLSYNSKLGKGRISWAKFQKLGKS